MTNTEFQIRYNTAMQRMQSAIAFEFNNEWTSSAKDAKHLRVGINSALMEHGALISLLLKKGIFTETEYFESLLTFAVMEADRVEREVKKKFNLPAYLTFA